MDGNIIKKYDSLKEASKGVGLCPSAISKAVLKINNTAGGYKWKYEEPNNEASYNGKAYTTILDISKGKQVYDNHKYYVFPDGTIYNNIRKAIVKPIKNAAGYCYVTISNNRK
jgi:hypothetical protein